MCEWNESVAWWWMSSLWECVCERGCWMWDVSLRFKNKTKCLLKVSSLLLSGLLGLHFQRLFWSPLIFSPLCVSAHVSLTGIWDALAGLLHADLGGIKLIQHSAVCGQIDELSRGPPKHAGLGSVWWGFTPRYRYSISMVYYSIAATTLVQSETDSTSAFLGIPR